MSMTFSNNWRRIVEVFFMHRKIGNFVLALLYRLRPKRLPDLPGLCYIIIRYWLSPADSGAPFPPVELARKRPPGLLAVGGPLTTARLVQAYRNGIYPHCHSGPMGWWAPSERMMLFPHEFYIGKTLRRVLRQKRFRVTFDQSFRDVINACAAPRSNHVPLTWISDNIIESYCQLFEEGYAHSVEVWNDKDELVGGCYGVSIGRVFFTESQFMLERDMSKVAFAYLNCHLQAWGFYANDCKHPTAYLESLGARMITRKEFTSILEKWRDVLATSPPWTIDANLNVAEWEPVKSKNTQAEKTKLHEISNSYD